MNGASFFKSGGASLFRQKCSECGSAVRWLEVAEAERDPAIRPALRQARSFVGPVESVWQCLECGELGFFAGWAVGF